MPSPITEKYRKASIPRFNKRRIQYSNGEAWKTVKINPIPEKIMEFGLYPKFIDFKNSMISNRGKLLEFDISVLDVKKHQICTVLE